jgi:hypothetical protein
MPSAPGFTFVDLTLWRRSTSSGNDQLRVQKPNDELRGIDFLAFAPAAREDAVMSSRNSGDRL